MAVTGPLLEVKGLEVAYGDLQVLWGVDIHVDAGELVCLLGPNGSGKSTLMNSISGLIRPRAGEIRFDGTRIDGRPPHEITAHGVAHVLERRRLFPYMTVDENLRLGAYLPAAAARLEESLEGLYARFPVLREKRRRHFRVRADTASGIAIVLSCPGIDDPLPHGGRPFARRRAAKQVGRQRRHVDGEIESIAKRTGEPGSVRGNLLRSAPALAHRIAGVPARARIHGGDEHEARREDRRPGRARDHNG